jgi:type IV fimbrial biogenesis protein FimT
MNRCDSHRHPPVRPRRQRGFTLVEMVIVVFMVGVLATLAGPLFRDFVIQQSIRNAAYELMSDLTYARSEAVKRNLPVTMSKTGSKTGIWTGGWTIAAGATTLRQHPALSPNITITMASSSVDYLLNGRASSSAKFTIDDTAGKASIVARCVSVDPGGRPQSLEGSCP